MRLVAVIALSLIATACAPLWQQRPANEPDLLWQLRHKALVKFDQWQLQGRTAITQGKEGWNAGLRWQENHGAYQIKIEGPFSQGGVTLDGDDRQAVLTMTNGQKISATDPEVLIKEALGIQLPVSALRDWVRGIPYSSIKVDRLELDAQGQVTHLVQQDWDISLLKYVPFGNYSLPTKIFIKNQDLSLRLAVTRWNHIE
ncbi:MAG: lipoprotein insertase outer membrane protein LolB [Pseudomonadota bacterium]|nr:lipoprotein insertase outer membrane protein LolB [Pseudomonadota bacterium]